MTPHTAFSPLTSTSPVLLLLHRAQSSPGRIRALLAAQGHELDIRRPALGEPLPRDPARYRGIVIFGGPMSANDNHDFVRDEIEFIGRVLAAGTPFLGICLGAQMLARQLGAPVERHPQGLVEIGFHRVAPTESGRAFLPRPLHVYQWHREGFRLPSGAVLLGRGEVFENQFFRYGDRAFGVQFHPEIDGQIMRRWIYESRHECCGRLAGPGAQGPWHQHLLRLAHGPALATWLGGFMKGWLDAPPVERAVREPPIPYDANKLA